MINQENAPRREKATTLPASRQIFVRLHTAAGPRWGMVIQGRVSAWRGEPWDGRALEDDLGLLETLSLLAPATPTKIVAVGRIYAAHAAEHGGEVPPEPLLFLKPPSSVIGPGATIVLPPSAARVEHEAELALVIGRRCRNVTPAEAWACVFGITCANDVTARGLQRRDGQWTRAKGFDTFCPVGPWLVRGLSAAEASALTLTCRVNGTVRQQASTGEMVFPPAELLAYASSVMTLEPGDLLLTGTPAGVGPLTPGDMVEVELAGIGRLCNPVSR